MSSNREYLDFVLEQLEDVEDITYKMMMGEYILYYKKKLFAYLCDNRVLLKITDSAIKNIKNVVYEKPYTGAKDMILFSDIEDREFFKKVIYDMYEELPMPKVKVRK